jgi:choline-glycine betaine transporter
MTMRRLAGSTIDPGVFGVSISISMLFVLWGVFFTGNLSAVASAVLGFLIDAFGWVFILAAFAFLVFVIFLAFSRYGRISRGILEPSKAVVVVWGALAGAAAAILLLAGGLESLQQAAIISAAPFVLVMICMCYSLFKELRKEPLPERRVAPEPERASVRPRGVAAPQQSSALDREPGR